MGVFSLETKFILAEGNDDFNYVLFANKEQALKTFKHSVELYYDNEGGFLDDEVVEIDADFEKGLAVVRYENDDQIFISVVAKPVL